MENEPAIRKIDGRNADGTFAKGNSGNPSGRPKNTLKDYLRQKFCAMTDEEKEKFLEKVPPEVQFKMAEGNPAQDLTNDGGKFEAVPIYGGLSLQRHNSDSENIPAEKED